MKYILMYLKLPQLKGRVMQIEKALLNDRLSVLNVSGKFRIPSIYNFPVIYP